MDEDDEKGKDVMVALKKKKKKNEEGTAKAKRNVVSSCVVLRFVCRSFLCVVGLVK